MYLETVFVLSKKGGVVRSIDVCEYMGYSKPSVSRAVGLLKNGGYLTMAADGALELTDAGREVAERMYERHVMITNWLVSIGVEPQTAASDACRIEHVLSEQSFEAIKRHAQSIKE